MSKLPALRSESAFADRKPAYSPAQARVEANRCLYCHDAPCIQACPTSIDIPTFIRKIGTDNQRGSARTILDSNILGYSCARVCPVEVLCVGACVYNQMGVPPIQIGKLQRYATEHAVTQGWTFYEAGPDSGKSVGLIGGGPASLAAAHRLRRFGHAVTIYEARDMVGGLNATGVAPYKMPADDAMAEAERVLSIGGIELRSGVRVPQDLSWAELERRHDALFIGIGLGPDSALLTGERPAGVHGAVAWIEQMKLGTVDVSGVRNAVVVGGGNTAVDAVRELLGLGVENVKLVYRGVQAGMSGYAHEWDGAKKEGARAVWQTVPTGWQVNAAGGITGLRCLHLDADKQPIAGTEHEIAADLVLLAIGQGKLGALVADLDGVVVSRGRIQTGPGGATGRPGVYAGGDCVNGGKEVVNAVAEGRDAALAMHTTLTGGAA